MTLIYKLVQRKNLYKSAPEGSKLFYAQAKSTGIVDFKKLTKRISRSCTLTGTDVKAVLDALVEEMKEELAEGKIVRLDGFGSFRITFGSMGTKTEKEFKPSDIRRPHYTFVPGADLKEQALIFKYSKYVPDKIKKDEEEGNEPNPFPDNV